MLLLSLRHLTRFKPLWLCLPIVGLSLLSPGLSQGAEWSLKGSLDQSLSYNDNVFMRSDNPQASFQYRILPVLTFQHKTDVSEIHANALYGTQIYTDIENLDQKIQNYGLGGLYKTQMVDWGLSANLSLVPTRNTGYTNGGVFNTNSETTTWSVSPTASYKFDEINSLVLTPTYSETTFTRSGSTTNQGLNNNFSNNTSVNVNLAWQRLWTDRYTSSVNLTYSNFNTQQQVTNSGSTRPISSSFDTVGINFSNTYLWTENWNFMGTVGVRHTESNIGTVSSSSFGFLANVGVNYTGESFSSGIHLSRSLTPSNQGQLQEQTSVGLNFSYHIIERLSANFTTDFQQSTLVNNTANQTRENISVYPSLRWMLAPDWTLIGSYRYSTQKGAGNTAVNNGNSAFNGVADSNVFMLSVNYNWHGLELSR
jgi:hypothetical protein